MHPSIISLINVALKYQFPLPDPPFLFPLLSAVSTRVFVQANILDFCCGVCNVQVQSLWMAFLPGFLYGFCQFFISSRSKKWPLPIFTGSGVSPLRIYHLKFCGDIPTNFAASAALIGLFNNIYFLLKIIVDCIIIFIVKYFQLNINLIF